MAKGDYTQIHLVMLLGRQKMEMDSIMADNVPSPPYPAPPIVEAMVQFHFADQLKKTQNDKLLKRLKSGYSHNVHVQALSANLDFQNRHAGFVDAEPQLRLSSNDEADVLIVQSDTLTWSRVAPYQGWDALLARVKSEFELANKATGYRKIDRLGVRYINRIDVPLTDMNLAHYENYIQVHLKLPPFVDPLDNYAWRFEKVFRDEGLVAIVQSTTGVPVIPETIAFVFDIDIVAQAELSMKPCDIFAKLESMRELKNNIFELSMTNEARKSFQ